jgi:hypothetical protein
MTTYAEYETDSRILLKRVRMIDPELRNRGQKHQQPNQEIFRRIRVFARKDQQRQH